jgi:hypothetical protein
METKLKPFDLAAALEGKKVITRSGKILEDFHYFKSYKGDCPIYGTIDGSICSFYLVGKYSTIGESAYDLFMAPETVTKWANIYNRGTCYEVGGYSLFDTEKMAKDYAFDRDCITVPITFYI